jgi:membrane associated rhomboid family serine protease
MADDPFRGLPRPLRWAIIGAIVVGALGGLVGMVVGLRAHPPTAPFAIVEVAVPGAIVGAFGGLAIGALTTAICAVAEAMRRGG